MRAVGLKLLSLAWTVLLAAGCASTSSYQQPISTFATAADKAATAVQALDADATAQLNSLRFQKALSDKRIDKSGCRPDAKECVLTLVLAGGAAGPEIYTPDLMPKTVALWNGFKDYAAALDALEKADATKDVQDATGKALGSAASVAGSINAIVGTTIAAIKEPVAAVAAYGYGLYQDNRKQAAIARAVQIMDGVIQDGRDKVTVQLKFIQTAKLAALQKTVDDALDGYNAAPNEANLKAAIDAAKVMDATIKAGLPDLYNSLADAHAKLKEAVIDPKADIAATFNALSAFLVQAQNVKDIADQIENAGK
jgi:hypothetical protein